LRLDGDLRNLDDWNLRKLSDPLKVQHGVDGDGVEIYFHPTVFLKSYRTIIKNRLFGRQTEWDEKGKVISNVDLDFPQKWNNAPKRDKK
jgi:hypothetical protein